MELTHIFHLDKKRSRAHKSKRTASEEDVALFLYSDKQTLENQDMDFANRIQA